MAPAAEAAGLSVRVLGPLRLVVDGAPRPLPGDRARLMLGLLCLQPGRAVAREEIAETLWDGDPPRTYVNLVQGYASRLRRALARRSSEGELLVREHRGYRLDLDAATLDAARFGVLRATGDAAARRGDQDPAAGHYEAALDLWRGPLLGDLQAALGGHPAAIGLRAARAEVAIAHADGCLALGRPRAAVRRLRQVAASEPLHEGLHAHLVTVLAAAGERAEALAVFDAARRRLRAELGVVPGVPLREAHQAALRGDAGGRPADRAPTPPGGQQDVAARPGAADGAARPGAADGAAAVVLTPRQLPPEAAAFVGRVREARLLRGLLHGTGTCPALVLLSGTAGVGKTALALRCGHDAGHDYPEGHLYANLRGHGAEPPLRPAVALQRFLRALAAAGVELPDELPDGLDELSALWRSAAAGRRLLIVLDDAADSEQVRPLLPGSASCATLVTSRSMLTGLVVRDGARRMLLDPLPRAHAVALLRALAGGRIADGPAVRALAEECARLPVALRAVAERLDREAGATLNPAAPVPSVGTPSLDVLAAVAGPMADLADLYGCCYERLPDETRHVFRCLATVRAPVADVGTVALRAALPLERTAAHLDRLAEGTLVRPLGGGRYRMHGLLRAFATGTPAERTGARDLLRVTGTGSWPPARRPA